MVRAKVQPRLSGSGSGSVISGIEAIHPRRRPPGRGGIRMPTAVRLLPGRPVQPVLPNNNDNNNRPPQQGAQIPAVLPPQNQVNPFRNVVDFLNRLIPRGGGACRGGHIPTSSSPSAHSSNGELDQASTISEPLVSVSLSQPALAAASQSNHNPTSMSISSSSSSSSGNTTASPVREPRPPPHSRKKGANKPRRRKSIPTPGSLYCDTTSISSLPTTTNCPRGLILKRRRVVTPRRPSHSSKGANKPRRRKSTPGHKALREIREYQRSTQLLIPKASFQRLVREISEEACKFNLRWSGTAMEALQIASEDYLVTLLEEGNLVATYYKRCTLKVGDIRLTRRLRGDHKMDSVTPGPAK